MASIHLVYVRIPGKGITLHRLLRGDDDDTSKIGIGKCYAKIIMVDLIKSEMEVDDGRDSNEKPEGRSEQNMNACYPF
jgi:hypothetical protein